MENSDVTEDEEDMKPDTSEMNVGLLLDSPNYDPVDPLDEEEVNMIIKQEIEENLEFKCRCCKFVANSFEIVEKHENGHRARGTFLECEYCEFCTNTREVMIQHVTKHTGERPFSCTKCEFRSRWRRDLIKHQVKHSDEKKFMCSQCDFTTKWYNNIRHHQITHSTDRPFTCHICDMKFKRKTGLDYHLYRHNDYKPKKCSKCEFRCKTNFELNYHQHKHSDVRNFPCTFPGCAQKCKTKSDLNKHVKIHTNIRDKICEICNKGFVTFSNLSKHKLRHVTERKFKCDLCTSKFKTRTSLRHHLKTHNDHKPFSCDVCGHRFRNKHNMNTHKLTHSDDRQFKCPICPYAGKFPFHIFAHIGTFHGDQFAYFCEICRKPFSRYSQLQTHCGRMHKGKDLLSAKTEIKQEIDESKSEDLPPSDNVTEGGIVMPCVSSSPKHKFEVEPVVTDKENMEDNCTETEEKKSNIQDLNPLQPISEIPDGFGNITPKYPENKNLSANLEDTNVIIYNIGPFRLPLASKGFNFNFDKTGKKPKHWFMEPQNMTDENAADKQRAYMEKKARNLERSRGATLRKFGWRKPPFKPRLDENLRYKREREIRKKDRETGRIFVKQDPELSELINVGRANIRKVKICKRAGQLMKNWKEVSVKLEKLDGIDVQSTHITTEKSKNITFSDRIDGMGIEQSLTVKKDTQDKVFKAKQPKKKRHSDFQESSAKKRKVSLKKGPKKRGRKPKAVPLNDTEFPANNKVVVHIPTEQALKSAKQHKVKRPVGRPRKFHQKQDTLQSTKIKSVNDLIIAPLTYSTGETGSEDEASADGLLTQDNHTFHTTCTPPSTESIPLQDTISIDTSTSVVVPTSSTVTSQSMSSSQKSTGRLTLAIDKLLAKKSKHMVVLNIPSFRKTLHGLERATSPNLSEIHASTFDGKRQRKSESPRKVMKTSSSNETIFTQEDDLPLSTLRKQSTNTSSIMLLSDIKSEPEDVNINDEHIRKVRKAVGRPGKQPKTIGTLPEALTAHNLESTPVSSKKSKTTTINDDDHFQENDSCRKILENLLKQPVRSKRNHTNLTELELQENLDDLEITESNQVPRSEPHECSRLQTKSGILSSVVYANVSLRELLSMDPINKVSLSLITTDLVGPEPERSLTQLDIHRVQDKDELIKIQKTLRNEKYRLKRLDPGSGTIEHITKMINIAKNIPNKINTKPEKTSTSTDYPILKNVLMRSKEIDSDDDVIITEDQDLHKPRPVIKICIKKNNLTDPKAKKKSNGSESNTKKKSLEHPLKKSKKSKKRRIETVEVTSKEKTKAKMKSLKAKRQKIDPAINVTENSSDEQTSHDFQSVLTTMAVSDNIITNNVQRIKRKYIKKSVFWMNKRKKADGNPMIAKIPAQKRVGKKKKSLKLNSSEKIKNINSTLKLGIPMVDEQASLLINTVLYQSIDGGDSSTKTDIRRVLQNYITKRRTLSLNKKAAKKSKNLKMIIKKTKKDTMKLKMKRKQKVKSGNVSQIKTMKSPKPTKKVKDKTLKTKKSKKKILQVKLPRKKKSTNVEIYVDIEESEILENVAYGLDLNSTVQPLVDDTTSSNIFEDINSSNLESCRPILVLPDDKFELLLNTSNIKTEAESEEEPVIKSEFFGTMAITHIKEESDTKERYVDFEEIPIVVKEEYMAENISNDTVFIPKLEI